MHLREKGGFVPQHAIQEDGCGTVGGEHEMARQRVDECCTVVAMGGRLGITVELTILPLSQLTWRTHISRFNFEHKINM